MTSENLYSIRLVNDTIDKDDIEKLIEWLKTNPRLTKGDLTVQYENKWAKWQGRKYAVFVNSGSSANLAMIYSLMLSKRLKNKKIVIPAISWVTTVSPIMQFGLTPIMCDCDEETLGLNIKHLKQIIEKEKPACVILVHVLGFPNKMKEILKLCDKYDVILLEDSCESLGSSYENIKTGNFGLMSSFSTYFGHHISTIEGGMITTDDEDMYHILLSIRSHGWDRDLPEYKQRELRNKFEINDFRALYTFYYPGFNLRSTDLQAFIGINQLDKLDFVIKKRNENFKLYQSLVKNDFWKIKELNNVFLSVFAYPIITRNIDRVVEALNNNKIETRPLICGSIGLQPFWKERYGEKKLPFADVIHKYGLYLPNNHEITDEQIKFICDIVNQSI